MHRRVESSKIVRRAEKDTSEDQPQKRREPAEHGGDNGPVYRPRPGDGRELMAEKHRGRGRHILLPVFHFTGRGCPGGIYPPLFRQKSAVHNIGKKKRCNRYN